MTVTQPAGSALVVSGEPDWRDGVVYQIYPRSFADPTATGSATCAGSSTISITSGPTGLDVDAIWLSPIYPSPGRDLGYDVSDHAAVDPLFGTEADFDRARRRLPRRAG